MNTDLLIAFSVPWIFWGAMSALLGYAGRSWFNVLMVAVLVSIVLLEIAAVASANDAMWTSILLHLFLLVYFAFSYIGFVIRERKGKRRDS